MIVPGLHKRISAPLWVQILAVVIGALAAAQLVTLALTVFFPPAPPQQYSLSDISAALRGGGVSDDRAKPLVLSFETVAPSLQSPGWLVSPPATRDLAKLVGVPETDVRLLFYIPPPLAGAPVPPPPGHEAAYRPPMSGVVQVGQAGGAGGSGPGPGGPGGGPWGGGGMPGGPMGPGGQRPPMTGGGQAPVVMAPPAGGRFPQNSSSPMSGRPSGQSSRPYGGAASASAPGSFGHPGDRGAASDIGAPGAQASPGGNTGFGSPRGMIIRTPVDAAVFSRRFEATTSATVSAPVVTAPPPVDVQPPARAPVREKATVATPAPIELARPAAPEHLATLPKPQAHAAAQAAPIVDRPLSPPAQASGFNFGRAPYVEGEFVAAMRMDDGRWATVRPRPEGFPNSWQRRVLLWFGLSLALIAPLALFVAWRLAAPLKVFAESAERLGREPSADLPPLTGPAEFGKAADAFNVMQQRVKRYVEDRTGMIRAISHDLRTPLTRMRFKLERASPALRSAISRDMDQMEEMISSVLGFLRDETQGAPRQVVDLRSLLEVVVDDAVTPVSLESGPAVLAEIDVIGVQRVVENLIDNAIKYGQRARVRLGVLEDEAFIEVADEGPGLSPDDLERVFQPFYRSAGAKASGKSGVGLGLSVSRATIRAHGGDLRLRSGEGGLVAEIRLPCARAVRAAA